MKTVFIVVLWSIMFLSLALLSNFVDQSYSIFLLILMGLNYVSFLIAVVVILISSARGAHIHWGIPSIVKCNINIVFHTVSLYVIYFLYNIGYTFFAGMILFPTLVGIPLNLFFILFQPKENDQ